MTVLHPIDVTLETIGTADTTEEMLTINLVQENPTYAPGCAASEHMLNFRTRQELEDFCASQQLRPIYDEDAQAWVESAGLDGSDEDDD